MTQQANKNYEYGYEHGNLNGIPCRVGTKIPLRPVRIPI